MSDNREGSDAVSNLVELLRTPTGCNPPTKWELQAADRIEALEAALRFALEVMESYSVLDGRDPSHATPSSAIGIARAALAEEQDK
jgi:hypothetical protein